MLRTFVLVLSMLGAPLLAQDRRPSHCIAIANATPGVAYVQPAAYTDPVSQYSVRLTYIDHSMFLLQTPGGLSAITDFAGFIGSAEFVPDVVTMNHAHSSHWTARPDPGIPHVLKGWGPYREGIDHYLDLGEMLIRNVSTDIRSGFGDTFEPKGNSIFVFEVEGLCIGHLGHLHHEPNEAQYGALGRLDVVMAAVDGGLTLPTATIARILKRLKSSVVIPMHWFGRSALDRFLLEMSDEFAILRPGGSEFNVSLANLPSRPTVLVLEPRFLPTFED